jgi:hypothetical protein
LPLAIALVPVLVLGIAGFVILGEWAPVPLVLGAIAAASFAARARADLGQGVLGCLAGLAVWLLTAILIAVLFAGFD